MNPEILKLIHGECTPQEEAALKEQMKVDKNLANEYAELLQIDADLKEALRSEIDSEISNTSSVQNTPKSWLFNASFLKKVSAISALAAALALTFVFFEKQDISSKKFEDNSYKVSSLEAAKTLNENSNFEASKNREEMRYLSVSSETSEALAKRTKEEARIRIAENLKMRTRAKESAKLRVRLFPWEIKELVSNETEKSEASFVFVPLLPYSGDFSAQ